MNNISIILLVGGKNTRLKNINNQNNNLPKSLQKINSKELIFHVIDNFIDNKFKNFILSIGNYKNEFYNFFQSIKKINKKKCNIFFDYKDYLHAIKKKDQNINLLLLNTGINTNKAERILKIINKLQLSEFGVSYGDGVGNVNIDRLYKKHINSDNIASSAAVRPRSQYGHYIYKSKSKISSNNVIDFVEKPVLDLWANIGYFFFKKKALEFFYKYFKLDLEMGVIKKIAKKNKLHVYKHKDFWKSVDTQKDVHELSQLLKYDKK